jgi:hypothetical protein
VLSIPFTRPKGGGDPLRFPPPTSMHSSVSQSLHVRPSEPALSADRAEGRQWPGVGPAPDRARCDLEELGDLGGPQDLAALVGERTDERRWRPGLRLPPSRLLACRFCLDSLPEGATNLG